MTLLLILGVAAFILWLILKSRKQPTAQKVNKQMTPTKPIISTAKFDFESPRLFQIIQESIQIINQTKNPATAIRRFDDIKRTISRLLDILPPGKTIDIDVNSRKITTTKDIYIIDEEKEKWMEEHKVKPKTTVDIVTIARTQAVEHIRQQELPITGISADAKEKLYATLADAAMKGQSLKDITGKIVGIIGDFEWPEFEKWCEIFKKAGEWPPLWDEVAEYFYLQDYPIEELLQMLQKDELLNLAKAYPVDIKKSHKKDAMVKVLCDVIPEIDTGKVLTIVNLKWQPIFLKAKSFLLAHSTMMNMSIDEIKAKYNDINNARIEISPAPDCCFICKKKAKTLNVKSLIQNELPSFHPGCRCIIIPAD